MSLQFSNITIQIDLDRRAGLSCCCLGNLAKPLKTFSRPPESVEFFRRNDSNFVFGVVYSNEKAYPLPCIAGDLPVLSSICIAFVVLRFFVSNCFASSGKRTDFGDRDKGRIVEADSFGCFISHSNSPFKDMAIS
jgi:hypothetical protein